MDNSGNNIKEQVGSLKVKGLQEGTYRLEITNNGDVLIKKISINQNKIVTNHLFLADNELYKTKAKPVKLFTKGNKPIIFKTLHKEGIQEIKVNDDILKIEEQDREFNYKFKTSDNVFKEVVTEKNDIIIKSTNFFSFSEESYFEPLKYNIVPLTHDNEWLENNVDFILTTYKLPKKEDNNWVLGATEFYSGDLYKNNNKINMAINIPHLLKESSKNELVSIDWIKVTIFKEGIF